MDDLSSREARLAAAITDLEQMRTEWEEMGRPMMSRGANLQPVPHPLVKMIADKEQMIERMSRPLSAALGGRPLGAESAPDRKTAAPPPRRGKLKAV